MPGPYSSYITAVQGIYAGLNPVIFPGGVLPYIALDEIETTGADAGRQSPPYVLMFDDGSTYRWTLSSRPTAPTPPDTPGNNATIKGGFRLEAYAFDLGDADTIIAAILWNGQAPNKRAGVGFATLSLILPQKGVAACVVPTRTHRGYEGLQYNNQRVHVSKQWFDITTAISGDGL